MSTDQLYGAYNFFLEIEGVTKDQKTVVGGFKKVSGMDSHTEIIEFKHGNDPFVRKKPGRTSYANIVLERGFTASDDLWDWRQKIEKGEIDRRSGSIIVLDQNMEEIARYNFFDGWPCKWEAPPMDAESSGMAIEKIELAVERVERAKS